MGTASSLLPWELLERVPAQMIIGKTLLLILYSLFAPFGVSEKQTLVSLLKISTIWKMHSQILLFTLVK